MSLLDWIGIEIDEGPLSPAPYGPYIQVTLSGHDTLVGVILS